MCRFLTYIGKPILMEELLFMPKNSLIKQSVRAHEAEEPLNGDGFGVGWYIPEINSKPARFVSVRPAWNDQTLQSISSLILSPLLFAHVRAASSGGVNEYNCHPFQFEDYLFMHNGEIGQFDKFKRYLRNQLSDAAYDIIQGDTDSEHLFALFISILKSRPEQEETPELFASVMMEAISAMQKMRKEHNIVLKDAPDYINAVVTNGKVVMAIKYVSFPDLKASSMYYSEGAAYVCHEGECRMRPDVHDQAVLIVSERLTQYRSDWREIPANSFLLVNADLSTRVVPCDGQAILTN